MYISIYMRYRIQSRRQPGFSPARRSRQPNTPFRPDTMFSTAFHSKNPNSCDEQPLLRISKGAGSIHARRLPRPLSKTDPLTSSECSAKSLFHHILDLSPYGSRFCTGTALSPSSKCLRMNILATSTEKYRGEFEAKSLFQNILAVSPCGSIFCADTSLLKPYKGKNILGSQPTPICNNPCMSDPTNPKTLQEAIQYFSDEQVCVDAVALMRWMDGAHCPECWTPGGDKGRNPYYIKTQKRWKSRGCRRQFSVKVDPTGEDSPIPLQKWLPALWMLVNCKNGVSSWELHRALGVSQNGSLVHAASAQTGAQDWVVCLQIGWQRFRRRRGR